MEIAIELKCLECEGQNVYESNSNFSQSIKAYIRKELTRGTDSRDIINDLHQKYGDEILMTPPVQTNTYVLWMLPFFLLSLGFFIFFYKIKKMIPKQIIMQFSSFWGAFMGYEGY